eukprot:8836330-Alexandrium_andersonii.AAC.1
MPGHCITAANWSKQAPPTKRATPDDHLNAFNQPRDHSKQFQGASRQHQGAGQHPEDLDSADKRLKTAGRLQA